jgi:hypothetical protein
VVKKIRCHFVLHTNLTIHVFDFASCLAVELVGLSVMVNTYRFLRRTKQESWFQKAHIIVTQMYSRVYHVGLRSDEWKGPVYSNVKKIRKYTFLVMLMIVIFSSEFCVILLCLMYILYKTSDCTCSEYFGLLWLIVHPVVTLNSAGAYVCVCLCVCVKNVCMYVCMYVCM